MSSNYDISEAAPFSYAEYRNILQSLSEIVLNRLLLLRQSIQDEADMGKNARIERILEKKEDNEE